MSTVGERELRTQLRVVDFFRDALGYAYLGHWKNRPDNGNVERALLGDWLERQGHSGRVIDRALFALGKAAALGGSKTLYDANRDVYGLLRYGVKVRPEVGESTVTVWLIDWTNPAANDFGIAEEVTVAGENAKRPDLVLYVNGIALGVLELKRSIAVGNGRYPAEPGQSEEGVHPARSLRPYSSCMAGNDSEGLGYGVIETPEKYWLTLEGSRLPPRRNRQSARLRALGQLCCQGPAAGDRPRFHGLRCRRSRKICRHNQYFGVRAAQEQVRAPYEGGIIWHTQGSGKSLIMVWLAKWIREHVENGARVLMITDRTELDEQIVRRSSLASTRKSTAPRADLTWLTCWVTWMRNG